MILELGQFEMKEESGACLTYLKMFPQRKTELIEALAGGKYNRGYGLLKQARNEENEFNYCCLGVECELGVQANIIEPSYGSGLSQCFDSSSYFLGLNVFQWAFDTSPINPDELNIELMDDFDPAFPVYDRNNDTITMSLLNDWANTKTELQTQPFTWTQIIDMINHFL